MDQLYSTTLLLSLSAGVLGTAAAVAYHLAVRKGSRSAVVLRRTCLASCVAALVLGIVSSSVHYNYGHAAGAQEPMSLVDFTYAHRVYWAILALSLAGLIVFAPTRAAARYTTSDRPGESGHSD